MNRILIIRSSSIGDIVMASAMLGPLRSAFPKARIAWVCEPAYADIIRCHPDVAAVHIWPKLRWKTLLRSRRYGELAKEILRFSRTLRQERFDLVLDAQGLFRSRLLAWITAAPLRVGLLSKEPGTVLMHRIVPWNREDPRPCSEYGALLRGLNVALGDVPAPSLFLCPEDVAAADRILKDTLPLSPFAVFCPFTTRPQKHWVPERWPRLAEAIHSELGLAAVLLGGPGDMSEAHALLSPEKGHLYDFTGRLSLAASAAVVRRASLVVGVDTGLTHMGMAFHRPTVALFGSTRPYLTGPTPRLEVIFEPMACSPCRRRPTCHGAHQCMDAIDTDRVMAAVRAVMTRGVS